MKLTSLFPENSIPTWICALSSVVLLLTVLSLELHLRLSLGHWPSPVEKGYESTVFTVHEWILFLVAHFAVFMAIPTWPFLLLFKRFRVGVRTHMVQSTIFSVGWILIILFYKFDPVFKEFLIAKLKFL